MAAPTPLSAGNSWDKIRRWIETHPRPVLTLAVFAALGPFLAKPFNIDDPLFIRLAQHVQAHPENPFGFDVNWYGFVSPMWTVTENPPLAGYYFALAGGLFGWSEIGLHFAGLLATLAVILGTHRLALRLCGNPLLAACMVLFTPIFLVSASTIMCDVLMLAFWVWAVVFWVEGLERNHFPKILFAGVLVALAMLTKYFGVALIPLLAVYGVMQKRKSGGWVIGLLIPLAALGAYQWLTHSLYGHALFSDAAGFVTTAHGKLGFSKLVDGLIALAFIGGGVASTVFLAPLLWRARTLVYVIAVTVVVVGALYFSGIVLQKFNALEDTPARTDVIVQLIFWAAGGVLVLLLAVTDILHQPRDPRAWLLGLWLAGTFVFTAFGNWTVNGRSLLPLLPAVGILAARRWELCGQKRPRALKIGLAASAVFALFVAQSDFQLAIAVRRSAQEVIAKYGQDKATIWFEGHWGFQYYMEQLGARAVDYKNSTPPPGDILVMPLHNTYISEPLPGIVARRDVLSVPGPSGLTTWNAAVGAGFYSSVAGPLPFAFGKVPAESVFVYELKTAAAK
jgi:4-amino-4-deoxy-L-arabinose transferase-like glycosyltransferase